MGIGIVQDPSSRSWMVKQVKKVLVLEKKICFALDILTT